MRFELTRPRKRLISLTPLIDVVFILLVFFMLASSFLDWRSIVLDAPAASATGNSMEKAILVRIDADGKLDLNGETIDLENLGHRVDDYLERNPDQSILVQPQGNVQLQFLVTVLDRLAESGGRHISLIQH